MHILRNGNYQKPQPNGKPSWTRFRYCAISCQYMLYGTGEIEPNITLEDITLRVMEAVANKAAKNGRKWNVFNLNLLIKFIV